MGAKILYMEPWRIALRKSKQKPEPTFLMIAAKENERIAENAARTEAALDRLGEIPSDSEA